MKPIRDILEKLLDEKINLDEAETEIDFIVMSLDCPKEVKEWVSYKN